MLLSFTLNYPQISKKSTRHYRRYNTRHYISFSGCFDQSDTFNTVTESALRAFSGEGRGQLIGPGAMPLFPLLSQRDSKSSKL